MGTARHTPRILIADDERDARDDMRDLLQELGYTDLCEACDGFEALREIHVRHPDLMLLDIMMPHIDGLTLLESLRKTGNQIPVVVITGMDPRRLILARHEGTLRKPYTLDELQAAIEAATAPPHG